MQLTEVATPTANPSEVKASGKMRWLIALGIGLYALAIYAKRDFYVAWDLSEYLSVAKNLAEGFGLITPENITDLNRIAFHGMLAIPIALFGDTLQPIAWTIIGFSCLFVVLIFLLGARLYGNLVGILAALGFLVSPQLVFWVPRHIDPVWPCYLFIALIMLLSQSKRDVIIGMGAAAMTIIAFMTKNVALLFVVSVTICWALGILPGSRQRPLYFFITLAIALVSWEVFSEYVAGHQTSDFPGQNALWSLARALQTDRIAPKDMTEFLSEAQARYPNPGLPHIVLYNAITALLTILHALGRYVKSDDGLMGNIPAAPAILGAFFLIMARGIANRNPSDLVMMSLAIAFLPLVAVCAILGYRFPQALVVTALLYLAAAAIIVSSAAYLPFRATAQVLPALLAVILVSYGASAQFGSSALWPCPWCGHVKVILRADKFGTRLMPKLPDGSLLATNDSEILNNVFWRRGHSLQYRLVWANAAFADRIFRNDHPNVVIITKSLPGADFIEASAMAAGYAARNCLDAAQGVVIFLPTKEPTPVQGATSPKN